MISVKDLSFAYGKNQVFKNLNISFNSDLNVIIGSNASGKTTLLKCIFGLLKYKGDVYWQSMRIGNLDREERAELMAYLPQSDIPNSSLTVFETVLLGQISSLSWKVKQEQLDLVYNSLKALSICDIAEKKMSQLSGGQKKLVTIAQTLVRNPKVILMDEPTNNLDIQKQLELFEIIKQIIKYKRIKFIIVLHDINLALRYADKLIILDESGAKYAGGRVEEIVSEKMLKEVYGVNGKIIENSEAEIFVVPESSTNKIRIFKED